MQPGQLPTIRGISHLGESGNLTDELDNVISKNTVCWWEWEQKVKGLPKTYWEAAYIKCWIGCSSSCFNHSSKCAF